MRDWHTGREGARAGLALDPYGLLLTIPAEAFLAWMESGLALDALQRSANVARSQHATVQLGRTLAALTSVARSHGDAALGSTAETELTSLIEAIGPEVRGLPWARDFVRRSVVAGHVGLTAREREVAALIADGRMIGK
jgi:hypothetical protein